MIERLRTRFLEKVWGSTQLEPWFPNSNKKIGEVWFEADHPLPLLVKFLFTTEPLSVQVHPEGKTEMWHILAAEPGARIAAGFLEPISKERLRSSALSGEIEELLQWHEARPGDTFFIPAGTVHAIGAGLTLCEIQQVSDVTYRLYDYGRPRELHLDQAAEVSDLGPFAARQSASEGVLVSCKHFTTEKLEVNGRLRWQPPDRGQMLIVLEGALDIAGKRSQQGEAWYASEESSGIYVNGQATVLLTS